MAKFCYSRDEENYEGSFYSPVEAMEEAAADLSVNAVFWVGEAVPPSSAESIFCVGDWLEQVAMHEDYQSEWADGWDRSTVSQRETLEKKVRAVMTKWIERYKLRPTHFIIRRTQKWRVKAIDAHGNRFVEPCE